MCVGYSHSGKTTFAKKLKKATKNTVVIDNDDIALFVNQRYPEVALSQFNISKKSFKDPNFKFTVYQGILDFCLRAGSNVILSNSNLGSDIRSIIKRQAKKYHYTLVTLFFNLPENIVVERAKKSRKNHAVFMQAKDWSDVLRLQKAYAKLPPSKSGTMYFEIKNSSESKIVFRQLQKMLG